MGIGAAMRTRLPVIALVLVPVMFHLAIVETSHIRLAFVPRFGALFKLGLVMASALTHWAIYGGLLLTFALTLRPAREPLITSMTRRLHGAIPDEIAVYTRRVTIAWCSFFAAQLATSITLFLFAPLVVWSFFVNILDIPLVVAMFSAEYIVRLHCLRNPPRHSLSVILNMISDVRKTRAGATSPL
jgi:uncharacterized membrane protein